MPAFTKEYERLNPEQRRAVDTIEGPVMVVAGPGTGKTQVLAVRVANILQRTHARPSNILCLTFSVSGSVAMRDRLRELVGGDAYGVTVSTVHSFADRIIREHPHTFSSWSVKQQLSDIAKYQLLQKIIDEGSFPSLINPKNPYEKIPALLARMSDCKREGKTYEDLSEVAKRYAAEMAEKSRKGTKAHEKNLLAAKRYRDFVGVFGAYQDALLAQNSYDYDDMILMVIQALREEDWLLASLQERYQYILVDEAQDLNGAQWKIIEQLTTYASVPHDPNFFLVGDDDQAIYRFQGANLTHMLSFHERFPKAPVVVLTKNYRSTQEILDAAGRLIDHNTERLTGQLPGLKKKLWAETTEKGNLPLLLRAASDVAEPWLLTDLIEDRLKEKISPSEIAILVQTNAELKPIYDVLRARDIPVILHGKADLLTHPIVSQAITILRAIGDTRNSDTLLGALACDSFQCHPADIARISFLSREQEKNLENILIDLESTSLPFVDKTALIQARNILFDLHQKLPSRTVLETVEHLLRESRLSEVAMQSDPLDLAVIEGFFHFVKERSLRSSSLDHKTFLKELNFYADPEFGQLKLTYQVPHLVTTGVELMTAHQSKGLEFEVVILPGFRDGHWDERRNPSSLSLPEDLLFGWTRDQKSYEKHQDERRVAYVAMTRAKRELLFLCPKEFSVGERARPVSPSAFFSEAGPLPEKEAALRTPEKASLLSYLPKRTDDSELKAYLYERLTSFALSPSSLSRFLQGPEEFKRADLLGQPQAFDESSLRAMGYGSAVHWALREWAISKRDKTPFTEDTLIQAFEWHLQNRNILTDLQRSQLILHAREALTKYFASRLTSEAVIHAVEREYRAHLPLGIAKSTESIPLKGKIDRIDRFSDASADAIVIDYKTGRAKTEAQIRGGIEPGKISLTEEGDYFRQLTFYGILLESAEPLLVPQVYAIEFIGERGEHPERREFQVTEQEKDHLKKVIRDVWKKVTALDFTPL